MDNPKLLRKINLSLILITCQLILIVTFGGGWTHSPISCAASSLIPYPSGPWWASTTAIILYITLAITFLYIAYLIVQVVFPDRIPLDLKSILFVDMIISGVLSLLLIFAFSFFAGGLGGAGKLYTYTKVGYSFWFCVIGAITGVGSMISAGLGWFNS